MTERRLRAMQLAIAAAGFAGVIAEVVLHEHWAEPWQVVPFFLCGAGIAAIAAFAARPGGATARVLRVVMLSAAVIGPISATGFPFRHTLIRSLRSSTSRSSSESRVFAA